MKLSKSGSSDKTYDIGGSFVASLDSGSSNNILPVGLGAQVCNDIGGTMNSRSDCHVSCAVRQQEGGVTFELEGRSILVPYSNLINEETHGEVATCTLMISDNVMFKEDGLNILGSEYTPWITLVSLM